MIPEQYWRILRVWFWLIGLIAIGGAALAIVAVPQIRGNGEPGNTASVTLGVTRLVSTDGSLTTIGGPSDGTLLDSYTQSIVARGNTPQFVAEVAASLAEQGLVVDPSTLARKVTFSADPGLFRVLITVNSQSPDDAQLIAQTAAQQMIDDTSQEETRVITGVQENLAQEQQKLTDRLNQVYADRDAKLASLGDAQISQALNDLIAKGIGPDLASTFDTLVADLARVSSDTELALMNGEAKSLESQLDEVSDGQSRFSGNSLTGTPVTIINPVSTVQLPAPDGLRIRDMALMGGLAGLVLGWFVAVGLDSLTRRDRRRTKRRADFKPAKVSGSDG